MTNILTPVQTGEGRIFINVDGFGVNTKFDFHNCMKMDGLDKSFGDAEPVYCPDPSKYDEFIEVAAIRGAESRWSSSLSGKLPADSYSALEILADQRCAFNLQVHYGRCSRPDDFNTFESAIILEDVRLNAYNLTPLTAANPGERALIEESSGITARNMYRIFNPSIVRVGETNIGTVKVAAIVNVDTKNCGVVCSGRSDGNQAWVAYKLPTASLQPASLIYTKDGGKTWTNKLTDFGYETGPEVNMVAAGDYLYISAHDDTDGVSIFKVELPALMNNNELVVTRITLLEDKTIGGMSASENFIWVIAERSIGRISKVSGIFTVVATLPGIIDGASIHALSDNQIVIGSEDSEVWVSYDGAIFTQKIVTPLLSNASKIHDVHMFNDLHWVALGDDGIYGTNDGGRTWTTLLNVTGGRSFTWFDSMTGYLLTNTGIFRSVDTGNTWKKIATYPINLAIEIVLSPYNPNFFMALTNETSSKSQIHKGFV